MRSSSGFTLLEALLSMAIIAVLAGVSLPFYLSFQTTNDLETSTQSVVQMLRRAEVYSGGVNQDSTWGVSVSAHSLVLFKGTNYATRTSAFDERLDLSQAITASGLSEVVFAKDSALPNTTGSVTLAAHNNTRTITLNAKGMVQY